jgi:hypothetical protein
MTETTELKIPMSFWFCKSYELALGDFGFFLAVKPESLPKIIINFRPDIFEILDTEANHEIQSTNQIN